MALIVVFYFWTALTNGNNPDSPSNYYYPLLAHAFVDGQLALEVEPRPELLALPDPYDPAANRPYRLHDASLYHGKYYIYFGPTPAVLLFAPYYFLTLDDFPQKIAVALFCSLGFLCSAWLFRLLVRDHFPDRPLWLKLACVLSLGLANTCPFLIRRPDVYEAAIGCAYFLVQLAFLSFYFAMRHSKPKWPWLLLTSACLGASVGARPNDVLVVFVFIGVVIWLWRQSAARKEPRAGRLLLALAPLSIIGLLLAAYNYARFDSPFEFGQHYQLAGININKLDLVQFGNVPLNLWFYFFSPPTLSADFPFLHAYPCVWFTMPDRFFGLEQVTGIFVIAPISLLALTLPVLIRKASRPLAATLTFMALGSLAALLPILIFLGATMRYFVDFAPTFIFLACIMACHFYGVIAQKKRGTRLLLLGVLALFLFLGCWNGLLLSLSGYYNFFKVGSPDTYAVLEHIFQPVAVVAKFIADLAGR
jgi:hypothetical protein